MRSSIKGVAASYDSCDASPSLGKQSTLNGSADPNRAEDDLADDLDERVPEPGYHALPVVRLGGSAGALAPLQLFFQNVPADSGAAYVVILHLSPEHEKFRGDNSSALDGDAGGGSDSTDRSRG